MQIILHDIKWRDPFSILTAIVTKASYAHGSIMQDGVVYDTTVTRGSLGIAKPLNTQGKREVTIIDLPDIDAKAWYDENAGKKYDMIGLIFFPLNVHTKDKWYCFEACSACLRENGVEINPDSLPTDGDMILDYFSSGKYTGRCNITRLCSRDVELSEFMK